MFLAFRSEEGGTEKEVEKDWEAPHGGVSTKDIAVINKSSRG